MGLFMKRLKKNLHWLCEQVGHYWDLFRLNRGLYLTGMAHTFEDNMNSAEYQCAQGCYIFLEELLNHNSRVNNERYQYSIPHVYNSTQDLSLDLEVVEAVKSNLVLDDESRLRVCNEDYIFSQDL